MPLAEVPDAGSSNVGRGSLWLVAARCGSLLDDAGSREVTGRSAAGASFSEPSGWEIGPKGGWSSNPFSQDGYRPDGPRSSSVFSRTVRNARGTIGPGPSRRTLPHLVLRTNAPALGGAGYRSPCLRDQTRVDRLRTHGFHSSTARRCRGDVEEISRHVRVRRSRVRGRWPARVTSLPRVAPRAPPAAPRQAAQPPARGGRGSAPRPRSG